MIVVLIVEVNNDNSISNSSSTMVITNHIIATMAVISIITVLISAVIANVTFSFKIHFTTLIINSLGFLLNFSSFEYLHLRTKYPGYKTPLKTSYSFSCLYYLF